MSFSMPPRHRFRALSRDDAGPLYVVTNFHVIQGASEATVKFADGRDHQARAGGDESAHDIAVLKIGVGSSARRPLRSAPVPTWRVGQKVFAIGNPFGLTGRHHRHRSASRPLVTRRSGRPLAIDH